jgi:hypothetical protein
VLYLDSLLRFGLQLPYHSSYTDEYNARYFVVRLFASRLSDRERLPVPLLDIEPIFIHAHSKDDEEAHRAYRLVSQIGKRRQSRFRLPFHPAAISPNPNDPFLKIDRYDLQLLLALRILHLPSL